MTARIENIDAVLAGLRKFYRGDFERVERILTLYFAKVGGRAKNAANAAAPKSNRRGARRLLRNALKYKKLSRSKLRNNEFLRGIVHGPWRRRNARRAAPGVASPLARPDRKVQKLSQRRSIAFHYHLVVKGTKARRTRTGANRGVMPANNYVTRAGGPILDEAARPATIRADLLRSIENEFIRSTQGRFRVGR